MSFRLFIYYSALCGGSAALIGWALGRWLAHSGTILGQGIKAMFLGLAVACALGLVDAIWSLSRRHLGQIIARMLLAALVGSVGGLLGGMLSQGLYDLKSMALFLVLGWMLTGLLIGAAPGAFDLLNSWLSSSDRRGSRRKVRNGILGGVLGGLLGGIVSVLLHQTWNELFAEKPQHLLWSPSALGFLALGICLGLFIGLAQVLLKEAWLRIVEGRRAGRELILSKPHLTIGRAEECDIGLFGDNQVERSHAFLQRMGEEYILTDAGTQAGTFVNGQRIQGPQLLRSGDRIQVGSFVLSFGERRKTH